MFRYLFLIVFSLSLNSLWGQNKLIIRINSLPAYHTHADTIFLAGNFNNWNPGDKRMVLEENNNRYQIELSVPDGVYEFKFTRGSWAKVESGTNGEGIDNHRVKVERDTLVELNIEHWADHFPSAQPVHTASVNVSIIDTSFYIPQLKRHRRISIYLPDNYLSGRKKYPVMYMHDGQNLFDAATSYSGEWGVDEAMDTLSKLYGEMIIVAIDNGGDKRLNEYSPYDMPRYGKGEGDQYVDFLANTLRPYINKNYRTKKCRRFTYVAGSSMGGLISLYAMLKYPKKFGGAGVFSPAFWIVPELKNDIPTRGKKVKGKIYFFAGMLEGEDMVPDMLSVFELMDKYSKADLISVIRAEGKHNESTWREEFPVFYKWLTKSKN